MSAAPKGRNILAQGAALGFGALTPPSTPLSRPGGRGEGGEGRCLNPGLAPWAMLCRSFGAEFLNELLSRDTGAAIVPASLSLDRFEHSSSASGP